MTGNPTRQLAALDEHAQLHVERHGVLGQVGAGDEKGVPIGDGAFDVQGCGFAARPHRSFIEWPDVELGEMTYFGTERAKGVVDQTLATRFGASRQMRSRTPRSAAATTAWTTTLIL